MEFKTLKIESFAVLPVCSECGNTMDNTHKTGKCYYSDPLMYEFKCSKCGKIHDISEQDAPHIIYKTVGE
jgi:DNA-directed RNA polymerase subunit RPC12/RpoP